MMKKSMVLIFVLLVACSQNSKVNDDRVNVVVSFYPLKEFAEGIGGEKVRITTLIPAGIEPHEWELSPQDVVSVLNADVFIYNGAGLEPWAERILNVIDKKKTVVVETTNGIELIEASEEERKENGEEQPGTFDPHVWLDPLRVVQQVENIKKGLIAADSSGAEFYEFNTQKFVEKLHSLNSKFVDDLSDCVRQEFVTSHEAFGYFAKRYNLLQIPIAGFSPEEEPTPQHIAGLIKLIKEKNIKTIFVETLVHPKVALALAKDTESKTKTLNPFEGLSEDELRAGMNYFGVMEQNLNKLKDALGCKW